ncbi:hypothetical protein [Pseudooceanicola sp.]
MTHFSGSRIALRDETAILHARENRFGRLIEKLETESLKVDDL